MSELVIADYPEELIWSCVLIGEKDERDSDVQEIAIVPRTTEGYSEQIAIGGSKA